MNAPDEASGESVNVSRRDRKGACRRAARSVNDTASVTIDGGRELPDQGSNLEPSG